ncbi:hypothetical protein TNCV_4767191 [Trichonephila clavipes]|nr:hypothetical protein TNCV_4767191 [Trichonephila clavipes]
MVCAQQTKIPGEYNRAIATGEVYKHKNTLPSEVLNYIKNVYRELSSTNYIYNLLAKCLHMAEETDQAIEEPDEIMHINRDSESKYEKSDRHETQELQDHRNGVFPDVTGIKLVPISPNQNALRIASGTEQTLIRKEDTISLISYPVFVLFSITINGGQLSTGGIVQTVGE